MTNRATQARLNQRRGAAEERAVKQFLRTICHASVWQTGKPGSPSGVHGHRGTMREPGLADLFVTIPDHALAFWWEVKSGQARLSPVQRAFRDACMSCGVTYGYGDLMTLQRFLVDRGVILMDGPRVQYRYPKTAARG